MNPAPEVLTGFLLVGGRPIERRFLVVGRVKFDRLEEQSRWEWLTFTSDSSLLGDDRLGPGPVEYPVLVRRSDKRVAMLSLDKRVVLHLLGHEFGGAGESELHHVTVRVHDLVSFLVSSPSKYVLSLVHAKIPAFGNALKSMSFYGDDVAEANLFRDNFGLLNCHTCGLKDVIRGSEIVRIGSDGQLTVQWPNARRLGEVEAALGFLSENNFIVDTLHGGERQTSS
jgi:hypothetical protein